MCGSRIAVQRTVMPTGRRIVTVNGAGFRHMAGLGSMTNLGVGRLIITDAGFGTTAAGIGHRILNIAGGAVGGNRLWSLFLTSATAFAGIRCLTITVITITTVTTTMTAAVIRETRR